VTQKTKHMLTCSSIEIRIRIFVTALSNFPGKHIQLIAIYTPTTEISFFNPANPPCPIHQVCKEARYGLNDCIQINNIQNWKGITRPIAFNPQKDCLVFDCHDGIDKLLAFTDIVGAETAKKIQKICKITRLNDKHPFGCGADHSKQSKVFTAFQALRELQILLSDDLVDGQLWEWRSGRKGYRVEEVDLPQGRIMQVQQFITMKYEAALEYLRHMSSDTHAGMPKIVMMDLAKEPDSVPISYDNFTYY
jgi:hypothetical protein